MAERETALFREDMTALRVLPPTHYVGAVEAMDEIAAYVVRLLDAGAAYRLDDDVYFSVAAAEHFGAVSRYDAETMLRLSAERGGDPDRSGKKDALDPLLWLAARPGEPAWDSPLGRGRPGWHVECSAIALNRLGTGFDVQGGGSDLVFPHHEMSAAHGEVGTGSWPFARAYAHAGMVGLDGEKMSKSKGNLVFVSRLRADGVDPGALRLALLSSHYRSDREWFDATLARGSGPSGGLASRRQPACRAVGDKLLAALRAALADDLDTPSALRLVDEWCAASGDDTARRRSSRTPWTRCWASSCAESGRSAPEVVLEADDVVLAEVGAGLHLDEDELLVAGVAHAVGGADGDVDGVAGLTGFSTPSSTTVPLPFTTNQCSARCWCLW